MDVLGLIPARGGSKGIPSKNLAQLASKPLIVWTIEAARAARTLTRAVVSTDDEEIAGVARQQGADVLDRPARLAADDTPMLEVIRHALARLGAPDVLVLLQPTSPLRGPDHIDQALLVLLEDDRRDSVVSVVEVPHRFRPGSLMVVEDGRLRALSTKPQTRRQDKPVVYARNGPAVLALRPERLGADLYGGTCYPYVMDERSSIDVDTGFDLRLAGLLLGDR